MFRQRNWTNAQLRTKFLQIASAEGWFDPSGQLTQQWAVQQGGELLADWDKFQGEAAETANAMHLLFGQPPYEFLQAGDPVPERLLGTASVGRPAGNRVSRSAEQQQQPDVRRGVASYSNAGKKPQFVDSLDKDRARQYWLRGSGQVTGDVTTSLELFEAMRHFDGYGSNTREVELAFRRPIRAHRLTGVEAPTVGEQLTLYMHRKTSSSRKRGADEPLSRATPPSVRATVVSSLVKTNHATGVVSVQLTSAGE